jgi:flagellar biogenesis protein FliO
MTKKKRTRLTLILGGAAVMVAGINYLVFGRVQVQPDPENIGTSPDFSNLAFQTIALMGLIILLIYVVVSVMRRFLYNRSPGRGNSAFEILSVSPLIPKKNVCVVKMVDRILVLGLTDAGISPLTEIVDPETRHAWENAFRAQAAPSGIFAEKLNKLIQGSRTTRTT